MNNSWHTTSSTLYLFLNKYHNFHLSPPPPPPPPPILFNVAYTRSSRRGLSCESKIDIFTSRGAFGGKLMGLAHGANLIQHCQRGRGELSSNLSHFCFIYSMEGCRPPSN